MSRMWMLLVGTGVGLGMLVACQPGGDEKGEEGDDAGECRDGADNDGDTFFDCDDQGCWGSPDCDEEVVTDDSAEPDDTGDEEVPDSVTDYCGTGPSTGSRLTSAALQFTIDIDISDSSIGQDCAMVYTDTATQVRAVGDCVEMEGPNWRVSESDCDVTVEDFIEGNIMYTARTGEAAYHSFKLTDGGDTVDLWAVHRDPGDFTPPFDTNNRFPIWDMNSPIDSGDNTLHYVEALPAEQGSQVTLILDIEFEVSQ